MSDLPKNVTDIFTKEDYKPTGDDFRPPIQRVEDDTELSAVSLEDLVRFMAGLSESNWEAFKKHVRTLEGKVVVTQHLADAVRFFKANMKEAK